MRFICEICGKSKEQSRWDSIISGRICYDCDKDLDFKYNLYPILKKFLKKSVFKKGIVEKMEEQRDEKEF